MGTRSIAESETKRRLGLLFALFLVLLLAGFLVLTPSYPPRSRLFPLLVVVPTLACMALVLASYVSDTADRIVDAFDAAFFQTDSDLFETEEDVLQTDRIGRALGWAIGSLLAFYLVGFVVTTFALVFAYLTIEGRHSRRRSLLIASVTTVFMYGLFVVLFRVRLDGGLVANVVLDAIGM